MYNYVMKEFLQGVLISLAITTPVHWMSNGFLFSPGTTVAPAMDPNMPGMDHSAPAAAPVVDESAPHSH